MRYRNIIWTIFFPFHRKALHAEILGVCDFRSCQPISEGCIENAIVNGKCHHAIITEKETMREPNENHSIPNVVTLSITHK